jgi:hypothetical protein
MTAKMTDGKKAGIGAAIVIAIAIIILIFMWPRKSSAATVETTPIPKPVEPSTPVDVIKPFGPDPYAPTTTPTPGEFYIPQHGDGEVSICTKAGLTPVSKAWRAMRDHSKNGWIPKTYLKDGTTRQLDLDWGYAHMTKPGFESKDWAYQTNHIASGGYAICLVYVPTQAEVNAA